MKILHAFRFREFAVFTREFFRIASQIRSVLGALFLLIAAGGWVLHKVEPMSFWDGQYLAFVTALTIGYGDLSPSHGAGKITCIVLGVVGMITVGLIVGVASVAVRRVVAKDEMEN